MNPNEAGPGTAEDKVEAAAGKGSVAGPHDEGGRIDPFHLRERVKKYQ